MKKEIGKRLENIRKNMHMSKEEFAKLIGMSSQYLGTVERGINGLTIEKLSEICKITCVTADYMLFGNNNTVEAQTKSVLSELNSEQIKNAFDTIKNVALFIKENNSK